MVEGKNLFTFGIRFFYVNPTHDTHSRNLHHKSTPFSGFSFRVRLELKFLASKTNTWKYYINEQINNNTAYNNFSTHENVNNYHRPITSHHFSHVHATLWLGTEQCFNRRRNLVGLPEESGPRFVWHTYQKSAPKKWSRFFCSCVTGLTSIY